MTSNGTTLEPEAPAAAARGDSVRIYRGRSMRELVDRIRSELGPDAIVLRSREGRTGGVAGFFAQRFVEVEATTRMAHIDVYDEEIELAEPGLDPAQPELDPPAATRQDARAALLEALEAAAADSAEEPPRLAVPEGEPSVASGAGADAGATSFSALLAQAGDVAAGVVEAELPVVVAGVVEPVVVDGDVSSSVDGDVSSSVEDVADAPVAPVLAAEGVPMVVSEVAGDGEALVVEALVGRGCSERLARWLVAGARTHALPFAAQGDLRGAVRGELAGALPRFGGLPPAGALVAVVGSGGVGKTRVAAALAVAYGEGSALSARAVAVGGSREGSSLVGLLAGHGVPVTVSEQFAGRERRDGQLVVVDTPARSPADADAIAALAERLAVLEPDAVLIAMPASIGLGAARQLLAAFAPLGASGLVVTHVDETDQHGVAVELSIGTGVPLAYLHGGLELRSALALASPEHLAGALLP